MDSKMAIVLFASLMTVFCISVSAVPGSRRPLDENDIRAGQDAYGYVNIRPNAYLFWWLYYYQGTQGTYLDQPLILWLQGGPGSSSVGYGNFVELGPYDYNLTYRETTWVNEASVLFVDQPVGTGYSYVTDVSALNTNNSQIADDMLLFFIDFFTNQPEFQTIPFYIFCESYGGKMNSEISLRLYQAIQGGQVTANFKGLALGDSWVSPMDSVNTWGPYLYYTSFVDENGLAAINNAAQITQTAVDEGRWADATTAWSNTETVITIVTADVNFYNILLQPSQTMLTKIKEKKLTFSNEAVEKLYMRHVAPRYGDQLDDLMNGPVRDYLGVIPDNVTWGGQSNLVFDALYVDFMKPVVDIVDTLLTETTLSVNVYTGMLDLIVDTVGTLNWVNKLTWSGMAEFKNATRRPFSITGDPVVGFAKSYQNFSLYWVLNAGHMIPTDQGWASVKLIDMIAKGAPVN